MHQERREEREKGKSNEEEDFALGGKRPESREICFRCKESKADGPATLDGLGLLKGEWSV